MSETLRDLVVSLSLNSDNFTRNIRSIQKQIQEAESAFKLAGAGVEKFEATASGLSAKLQTLTRMLSLQQNAVRQYELALAQASAKLQECYYRQNDYNQRLTDAKTRQAQLKQEVVNAATAYNTYRSSLGETDSVTIAAKANLDAVKIEYRDQCVEVRKLNGQNIALQKSTQNAADAFSSAQTKLNSAKSTVKETEAELKKCNAELKTAQSAWTAAGKAMEDYGKRLQKAGQTMATAGRTLTRYVSTPIAALGAASVKASISYESAFASVRKTVNATEAEFRSLSDEIEQMSVVVAASADDIAEVVAVAGQLGIENAHLMEFARTMVDLGNSTDIIASEASSTLAKFANIMDMDQSLFQNLGSTLVDLGNNYATTESAIMEMSMRLAGAGHQVGLTEAQILGFATALSAVGIEAQMGGSAFSKSLVKMEVASATGGQALEDFGNVAGMSAEQFKSLWERDPAAAFQAFIVGLSQMDDAGESAIAVLDEIGIKEVRLRDTLLRATNATELFSRTQKTANAAWEENTALTVEAEKRYATTESRLKNLKNKALLFARQIGDDLNPTIQTLINGASELIDRFMALDESQRMQIIKWAAIAAAIGPALLLFGKISKGVGTLTTGIGKFALAVGKAGGGWKGFFTTLGKSPAVWMAVAAAAITATIAISDYITGAKAARDAMNAMNDAASALKNGDFKTIYETGSGDPLGRFGITFDSVEQAEQAATETKTWLDTLTTEWSDARVESNETINAYVDSFTSASDEVRAAIQKRRDVLSNMGSLSGASDASMQDDMEQLATWDKEIEQLLIKRRERFLNAADKARLDEVITLRAQLKVQYATTDTDAYAQILSGIENEKARASAVNETVGIDLYSEALTAATSVRKHYLDSLNAEYDARRNAIQLMADESERVQAQVELDAMYAAGRQSQAADYRKTLAQVGSQAYSNKGIQDSISSIGELYGLLQGFNGNITSLEAVQAWMDNMDGGGLASVLTLMTQLADADLGEATLGFEPTALLAQWQTISNIASAYPKQLEGLNQVVNDIVAEKTNEVLVSLNLDTAAEQWAAFTDGNATFIATPTLNGLPESVTIDAQVPCTLTNVPDSIEVSATSPVTLTGVPDKLTVNATSPVTLTGVPEKLTITSTSPVTVTGLPTEPLEIPANTPVTLTDVPDSISVQADAPVTLSGLPDSITVNADSPVTLTDVPERITVKADSPVTLSNVPENLSINGSVRLNPLDDWRVTLWKSLNAPKLALKSSVSATVGLSFGDDWQAKLTALWEEKKLAVYGANGLPIDVTPSVISALTVDDIVVGLSEDGTYHVIVKPLWESATAEDASKAIADLANAENSNNGLFGTDFYAMDALNSLTAANRFYKQYGDTGFHGLLPDMEVVTPTALKWADDIITPEMATQIADTVAIIQGAISNGEPVDTNAVEFIYSLADAVEYINQYGKNEDVVSGILQNLSALGVEMDADGLTEYLRSLVNVTNQSLEVQEAISTACQKAGEYIEQAKQATDEESAYAYTAMAKIETAFAQAVQVGIPTEMAQEIVASAGGFTDALNKLYSAIDDVKGSHIPAEELSADIAWLDAYCDAYYVAMQRMKQGDTSIKQETLTSLDTLFVNRDTAGINEAFKQLGISLGSDAGAGVGAGLSEYDFSGDAAASANALETALRNAYGSHSPATLTVPIGSDAGAGIGLGLTEYAFTDDANASAGNLRTALLTALTSESMSAIGAYAASSLAAGVTGYDTSFAGLAAGASIKSGTQSALNFSALYSVGKSAMSGMAAGISSGQTGVISAMRTAARAAVAAAKAQLQIHSPSRVFRDEVGVMTMKGFGEGVLTETKAQAKAIRNAAQYLTGEAKNGSISTTGIDNRKTYNQHSSISFAGSNFYVNDKQDAYALAVEIASLTKRQQRGKGLRMA